MCLRLVLLEEFEAEFFDDGVGEDVAGDLFDFFAGGVFGEAVEVEDEEFALADGLDFGVSEGREGVLDGLALRVEDGGFGHDPDVSFHGGEQYSKVLEAEKRGGKEARGEEAKRR